MKTLLIAALFVSVFLLTGCVDNKDYSDSYPVSKGYQIRTFCEDRVICYDVGSGSCFRDKDLVEKYCSQATR